jgi:hypothetical protein
VLTPAQAAALEALLDERLGELPAGAVPPELAAELGAAGLTAPERRAQAELAVEAFATGRPIEWARQSLTQGEILGAFAVHCLDELDDVEVVESMPARLVVRWRGQTSRLELRAGLVACERLASDTPTMLLADLDAAPEGLVARFVDDAALRSRLLVVDLARLVKLGAVRSSAFVYLEWFLRDAYGVKMLPLPEFTQGLVDRGVIHLGMG